MRAAAVALALLTCVAEAGTAIAGVPSAACREGVVAALPDSDVIVFRKHRNNSSVIVYRGTDHAARIASCGTHHEGVVVLFESGKAYFSPDCLDLGGSGSITQLAYEGDATKIEAIAPYKTGVVTTFRDERPAEPAAKRHLLAGAVLAIGGRLHPRRPTTRYYSRDCLHLDGGAPGTTREPF